MRQASRSTSAIRIRTTCASASREPGLAGSAAADAGVCNQTAASLMAEGGPRAGEVSDPAG
jgi:hypothetical protein